jgi:sulfopyruvate decarboxylase TPP-binding subunit|tara:strand:+ start:2211 stop:2549 length:339 start_codon:yes stop_codon:yes gene_type:complete
LKYFIDEYIKNENIIITTREEESTGVAMGMALSKSSTLVFMQNTGFVNLISTITSLVQLYEIPLILLIGWRGYLSDDEGPIFLLIKISTSKERSKRVSWEPKTIRNRVMKSI